MRIAGLLLAAVLAAELLLRVGMLPNERTRRAREVRAARVLVLGDSFSLDEEGMAVGLLKSKLALEKGVKGPRFLNDPSRRRRLNAHLSLGVHLTGYTPICRQNSYLMHFEVV